MARTIYRKLVDAHTVAHLDAQNELLFCGPHLMNEYTSPCVFRPRTSSGSPSGLWASY
jgi:3-isopropylmalate/(R)-2-methylmalate dehydratase large subunit